MKRKNCKDCYYCEVYYIQYALHMDLLTALYSSIIDEDDRVNDMKWLINDYIIETNNKNIQSLRKYRCMKCKYRDRVVKTEDIHRSMQKTLTCNSILDLDKYSIIEDLHNEYFERTGPF
ncbi:MAG: hypothetical protein ACRC1T_13380 [Clostridium chrysemydis]|uniref:hypothetical protein n=1 Tax=Clostridium chrysemydis TaxID=2665504 RepID=UPI003F3DE446